jgi:hypothetical protein
MKNLNSKIYALLCVGLCLAAITLFINQKVVTASDGERFSAESAAKPETRCGWVSNPTPANWWLNDRDGEWTISVQGGYQASGADLPDFGKKWVVTNSGGHGYGCACINATTDKKEKRILTINSVTVRPLSACRKDKKLKEPKE